MKTLRIFILTAVLLLISAGLVMALSTVSTLKVTNTTGKSIKVNFDMDDGSGSSEKTLSSGDSHTFQFSNTAWYAKTVTHHNTITIYYDGKLAKKYELNIKNEVSVLGEILLLGNSFKLTDSYMECAIHTTTGTTDTGTLIQYPWAEDTMTISSCE